MIVKALLGVALSVTSAQVAPAPVPGTLYDDQLKEVAYPLVHRVDCVEGRGTAFRIGPTRFITAAHVTAHHTCAIDGNPIIVIEEDGVNDISIVEAGPPKAGALKVNCSGFHVSEWYWAVGYAKGGDKQTGVALLASAFRAKNGQQILYGEHSLIPGMSGGPVLNQKGEVVGINNAANFLFVLSFSRALRDTSVCRS